MKSLLMNLSLFTGFLPLPFGISVHISFAFSSTCCNASRGFSSVDQSLHSCKAGKAYEVAVSVESLHTGGRAKRESDVHVRR